MIKIIEPSVEIMQKINYSNMLRLIERAGRVCYKSEEKITKDSAEKFISMIIKRGHESVLEHQSITVKFICDRTTSHQLVRHRIAAYSQESQRYCNYNKNNKLEVICPPEIANIHGPMIGFLEWEESVIQAYSTYKKLIKLGIKPEDARSVLPGCTKTEVVTTMNLRQWRHVFKIRCDKHAQWQIRGLMNCLLKQFINQMPALFDDLSYILKTT